MKKSLILLLVVVMTGMVSAQSLEETLSNLSATAGKAYVKPVSSAFGSNLNSGWVHGVPPKSLIGFHFNFKVVAMGSFFSDDQKTFSESGTFVFSNSQIDAIIKNSGYQPGTPQYNAIYSEMQNKAFGVNFSGPTVNGKKDEFVKVNFPGAKVNGQDVAKYTVNLDEVKGFLDELPALPMAAVQVTAGTVLGTYVSVRYFPSIDVQDIGKVSFWGAGLIHNIGYWIPNPLPVDIGVGFFFQNLKAGDILETNATQFGLYASKTFGGTVAFTPYVGATMESFTTDVSYTYESNQIDELGSKVKVPIKMELEGENKVGFTVGFNIKLAVLNINADYKAAKVSTASLGLSLGF
ncbi:MAG: hypothetical protein M0P71_13285 [Melioribacteraceae bacterium]|nr:hypothetical protein [Melioribacteraceae bacterium]